MSNIIDYSPYISYGKSTNFGLIIILILGYNRFNGLKQLNRLYRYLHILLLISPNFYIHYKVNICRSRVNIKHVLIMYILIFIFLKGYNNKLKNKK
jgi:hypothetical protein